MTRAGGRRLAATASTRWAAPAGLLVASALDASGTVLVAVMAAPRASAEVTVVLLAAHLAGSALVLSRLRMPAWGQASRGCLAAALRDLRGLLRHGRWRIRLASAGGCAVLGSVTWLWAMLYLESSAAVAVSAAAYPVSSVALMRRRQRLLGLQTRPAWAVWGMTCVMACGCWAVLLSEQPSGWAGVSWGDSGALGGAALAAAGGAAAGVATYLGVRWVDEAASVVLPGHGGSDEADPAGSLYLLLMWHAGRVGCVALPVSAGLAWLSARHGWFGYQESLGAWTGAAIAVGCLCFWLPSNLLFKWANLRPGARPAHNVIMAAAFVLSVGGLALLDGLALLRPAWFVAGALLLLVSVAWAQTGSGRPDFDRSDAMRSGQRRDGPAPEQPPSDASGHIHGELRVADPAPGESHETERSTASPGHGDPHPVAPPQIRGG